MTDRQRDYWLAEVAWLRDVLGCDVGRAMIGLEIRLVLWPVMEQFERMLRGAGMQATTTELETLRERVRVLEERDRLRRAELADTDDALAEMSRRCDALRERVRELEAVAASNRPSNRPRSLFQLRRERLRLRERWAAVTRRVTQ